MQAQPGKQAPDRQALRGLARTQLVLNSFLTELAGGPSRFGQRAFFTQSLLLFQVGSLWELGASLCDFRQGPPLSGPPEFGVTETRIPTHLHFLLALGPSLS